MSELEHRYGPQAHILNSPTLLTYLARLCSPQTVQPLANELLTRIYDQLLSKVLDQEFEVSPLQSKTRMIDSHPNEGFYKGPALTAQTKVVSVNLARAGTLPSHICYSTLNYLFNPSLVRQDHISISRMTDPKHHVTGSEVHGHKIGGPIDDSIVLFPDPMGATGNTLCETLALYKKYGTAKKVIGLHCIITPEFIKKLKAEHPEYIIYAARLDRGLSPPNVLNTTPGTFWDQERGLNDSQYIVPGGGGFGEILNNSFV